MFQKNYTLHIDNPCDKTWKEMSPRDLGRYCNHCEKTVVDFTKLNDNEVMAMLEAGKGTLCGRFNENQLGRLLVLKENKDLHNNARLSKLVVSILLLAGLEVAHAQTTVIINASPTPNYQLNIKHPHTEIWGTQNDVITIKGKVIDAKTKEPVQSAFLNVNDTMIEATSDTTGNFVIDVPKTLLNAGIIFEVYRPGYKHYKTVLYAEDVVETKTINLHINKHYKHYVIGCPRF